MAFRYDKLSPNRCREVSAAGLTGSRTARPRSRTRPPGRPSHASTTAAACGTHLWTATQGDVWQPVPAGHDGDNVRLASVGVGLRRHRDDQQGRPRMGHSGSSPEVVIVPSRRA